VDEEVRLENCYNEMVSVLLKIIGDALIEQQGLPDQFMSLMEQVDSKSDSLMESELFETYHLREVWERLCSSNQQQNKGRIDDMFSLKEAT